MSTALLLPDAPVDRLLAVANETLCGDALPLAIDALVAPGGEVRVVCPALVSRARFWTSDLGAGLDAARDRLARSLDGLHRSGLRASGAVGDADPLLAIEDALHGFAAEHVLLSTRPPERSTWLERSVVERAQVRFGLPVTHVVVDLEDVPLTALAFVNGSLGADSCEEPAPHDADIVEEGTRGLDTFATTNLDFIRRSGASRRWPWPAS